MKEVTAERLLEVRRRIGRVNDRRFKGIYDLMHQCALTGMKVAINDAVGGQDEGIRRESQKIGLEAQFHGIPLNIMSIEDVQAEFTRGIDNRHKWYRWIDRIQLHHNISGLITRTVNFQGRTIDVLEQHDLLDRTQDDNARLKADKHRSAQFFIDSIDFNPHWHLMTDEGMGAVEATVEQIKSAIAFHDFGDVYAHNDGKQLHLRLFTPESDREPCFAACPNDSFVLYDKVYLM